MRLLKFLIFCLFFLPSFLFPQVNSFTDTRFRETAREGLNLMYSLEFDKAESVFSYLQKKHPDHPAPYFLMGMNRYWQTYISETSSDYYDICEEYLETSLEKNEAFEDSESHYHEYVFFQFMSNALISRLYALRRNWLPAVNAARKVISPLKKGLKLVGEAPEFYFMAGLYHYYVATYHKYYPAVRPFLMFFPEGNEELGLEQIEMAGKLDNFAQTEARFFLGYIYLDEVKQLSKGLSTTRKLAADFPRNTWFQTDYARALIKNDRYGEGEAILLKQVAEFEKQAGAGSSQISSKASVYPTFLMIKVYHYLGVAEIFGKRDYRKSLFYFGRSNDMARIAGVDEDNYLAGNEFYSGVCYDNLFQRENATKAYQKCLDMDENEDYKKKARKYLKTPHVVGKDGQ